MILYLSSNQNHTIRAKSYILQSNSCSFLTEHCCVLSQKLPIVRKVIQCVTLGQSLVPSWGHPAAWTRDEPGTAWWWTGLSSSSRLPRTTFLWIVRSPPASSITEKKQHFDIFRYSLISNWKEPALWDFPEQSHQQLKRNSTLRFSRTVSSTTEKKQHFEILRYSFINNWKESALWDSLCTVSRIVVRKQSTFLCSLLTVRSPRALNIEGWKGKVHTLRFSVDSPWWTIFVNIWEKNNPHYVVFCGQSGAYWLHK